MAEVKTWLRNYLASVLEIVLWPPDFVIEEVQVVKTKTHSINKYMENFLSHNPGSFSWREGYKYV